MTDDPAVHSEVIDVGTGEFVRVTVSFGLNVPGESGRMESVLVFPARMVYTVVASILGAAGGGGTP